MAARLAGRDSLRGNARCLVGARWGARSEELKKTRVQQLRHRQEAPDSGNVGGVERGLLDLALQRCFAPAAPAPSEPRLQLRANRCQPLDVAGDQQDARLVRHVRYRAEQVRPRAKGRRRSGNDELDVVEVVRMLVMQLKQTRSWILGRQRSNEIARLILGDRLAELERAAMAILGRDGEGGDALRGQSASTACRAPLASRTRLRPGSPPQLC